MGKFLRLLLLLSVALFLPRIEAIPSSGQGGMFVGSVAEAKSRTPKIHRSVAKVLEKAYAKIEAGDYAGAHHALDALAARDLSSYERAMALYYRAYASSEVGDYVAALGFADALLQLPDLPAAFEQTVIKFRVNLEAAVTTGEQSVSNRKAAIPGRDASEVPVFKVSPIYPRQAMKRRIEGQVELEFTVTAKGTVVDIVVVESDPPGVFDRAAINAAKKFRYRPKLIDGEPVAVEGVRNLITFNIAD